MSADALASVEYAGRSYELVLDHDIRSYQTIARAFDGKPEGLSRDDVLDNITPYWLTDTAISSARLYWDTRHNLPAGGFFDARGVKLPSELTVRQTAGELW